MGWFCQNQDFSFWGENGVKPGDSEYNPGYSGFGTLWGNSGNKPGYSGHWNTPGETPGIDPETPDLGVRILRAGVRILRVFGYFWVDKSNWGRSLVVVLGRWLIVIINRICINSYHMHTCSSRGRGGGIRSGCGATEAPGASPAAGGSRGVGPRPDSP